MHRLVGTGAPLNEPRLLRIRINFALAVNCDLALGALMTTLRHPAIGANHSMASNFYSKVLPDYEDLENVTGEHPGFELDITEQDRGIGVLMHPAPGKKGDGVGRAQVYMTPEEARELVRGLQEAIARAESKRG